MKRIFGGSKQQPKGPTLTEAVTAVDSRADNLDQKIKKLDAELVQYREQLKKLRPGPAQNGIRQKAMRVLKQKKMYEQQREQLMNQSFNMEQANFASQTMQDTVTTISAMKGAHQAMTKQFKDVSIDEIENLQEDMSELLETANEIQDTLGRSYSTPEFDEGDLEDELAALGDELEGESTPSYLSAATVPDSEPSLNSRQPQALSTN